jgi:hypothetical protein
MRDIEKYILISGSIFIFTYSIIFSHFTKNYDYYWIVIVGMIQPFFSYFIYTENFYMQDIFHNVYAFAYLYGLFTNNFYILLLILIVLLMNISTWYIFDKCILDSDIKNAISFNNGRFQSIFLLAHISVIYLLYKLIFIQNPKIDINKNN